MSFLPEYDLVGAKDGDPSRTVLVLHGILGSRRNWRSFSRSVAQENPGWRFLLVDLRGHGESHGAAAPHTLSSCAEDIQNLCASLALQPSVAWGHSFGGKVVLQYAQNHGRDLKAAWVLDAAFDATPKNVDLSAQSVGLLLQVLRGIPMPCAQREAALEPIKNAGFPNGVCQWMTTNLVRGEDGFRWRFDLDVVDPLYANYHATDMWPAVLGGASGTDIHLVYGGKSERWNADNLGRARALEARGSLEVHPMKDAGHWLHVDDPDGLKAILIRGLQRL